MAISLRHVVKSMYENLDYKYYYDKMVRDYERGRWDFDVRSVVKLAEIFLPCPKNISSTGLIKRKCLTIIDEEVFRREFARYMDNYAIPLSEIRKERILARKLWVKKNGFISKQQQECLLANYNCLHCINRHACKIVSKYNKDDKKIIKMTKMLEILYGNIIKGYWADMAEKTFDAEIKN